MGAGAQEGVGAQLRSRGSRCRRRRDTSQPAIARELQDLFSINCLREPLAEGFLSNTVFYKLRRQEEDATAARGSQLQKVPRSGSTDLQPTQRIQGVGRRVGLTPAPAGGLLTFLPCGRPFHALSCGLLNAFVCICPCSEALTENRSQLRAAKGAGTVHEKGKQNHMKMMLQNHHHNNKREEEMGSEGNSTRSVDS